MQLHIEINSIVHSGTALKPNKTENVSPAFIKFCLPFGKVHCSQLCRGRQKWRRKRGVAQWPGGWGATVAPRRRLRRRGSGEGVLDDRCNSTTYTFKHMNSQLFVIVSKIMSNIYEGGWVAKRLVGRATHKLRWTFQVYSQITFTRFWTVLTTYSPPFVKAVCERPFTTYSKYF